MHTKMSSAKWRESCLCFNVLSHVIVTHLTIGCTFIPSLNELHWLDRMGADALDTNFVAMWLLSTRQQHPVWASYQVRKIAVAHAPGMPGTFSPSLQVSDPDMHHGTCVTHVPWCMPGSLTSGFLWNWRRGKMFPAFPAHAQAAILHIW